MAQQFPKFAIAIPKSDFDAHKEFIEAELEGNAFKLHYHSRSVSVKKKAAIYSMLETLKVNNPEELVIFIGENGKVFFDLSVKMKTLGVNCQVACVEMYLMQSCFIYGYSPTGQYSSRRHATRFNFTPKKVGG